MSLDDPSRRANLQVVGNLFPWQTDRSIERQAFMKEVRCAKALKKVVLELLGKPMDGLAVKQVQKWLQNDPLQMRLIRGDWPCKICGRSNFGVKRKADGKVVADLVRCPCKSKTNLSLPPLLPENNDA